MQVKEVKTEGLSHELEITVSAEAIEKLVDEKLVEVGKTVNLPGFRKGKIPAAILKQKYGRSVLGEVLEKAVNDNTAKAMDEKGLKPAMQPKIEVKDFDEGKDLVYTVNVDVLPEFELADYKGLKLEKPVAEVSEEKVEEALNNIASGQKETKPLAKKRASKDGDMVVIDFKGRRARDDMEVPGMAAEGTQLELGSNTFIPGFEEQLVGKKIDDAFEVKVTFPAEYGHAELAGEEAIFDVVVKDILEVSAAELNDEFAKKTGHDTLEALTTTIKAQMANEYDQLSKIKLKRSLLDALDGQYSFDLPAAMVEAEHAAIIQQVEADQHRGHNHAAGEKCDQEEAMSDEDKAELHEIAIRRVRLGLVLSKIGTDNEVTVSQQDLQQSVIAEAQKYPGQEKMVFDYYSKNPEAVEGLRAPLFEQKVVDFITELATVKENTVSLEELMAEDEDEPTAKKAAKKKAPAKKKAAAKSDASDETKAAAKKKAPAKKKAAAKKDD